jgi:hypothetical protein
MSESQPQYVLCDDQDMMIWPQCLTDPSVDLGKYRSEYALGYGDGYTGKRRASESSSACLAWDSACLLRFRARLQRTCSGPVI